MKTNKKDDNYIKLVNHILKNKTFNKIESFSHHGTTRLNHSMRVSYFSYKVAKRMGLDYQSAAISGLLHDFYIGEDDKGFIKYIKFQSKHPKIAAFNAVKYFSVSDKEKNIIETHMCPFTKPSRYLEGWVVSLVDKAIGTCEYSIKYKRQFGLWFISLLKIMK